MIDTLLGKIAQAHADLQRRDSAQGMPTAIVSKEPSAAYWLEVGLSALLLELLHRHVRRDSAQVETYAQERQQALHEAALCDKSSFEAGVKGFIIPAARVHGPAFLSEAWAAFKDHLPRRQLLREILAAFKEAGLPDDPWPYLEPQLDRYASSFGLNLKGITGSARKIGIRTFVRHLARD